MTRRGGSTWQRRAPRRTPTPSRSPWISSNHTTPRFPPPLLPAPRLKTKSQSTTPTPAAAPRTSSSRASSSRRASRSWGVRAVARDVGSSMRWWKSERECVVGSERLEGPGSW
ncbi:RHTO0S06e00958g1_1 [Rhodotorula toruloides]|uniref:RHTO0S06e00958g1_1 n=1 Tax=Rhodotorula toruloides TaxID=5286 RepID=A0A061AUT0_RHOTO|nr:RHTO0S06e00958g1_1 [Rhodotorula toruloides]